MASQLCDRAVGSGQSETVHSDGCLLTVWAFLVGAVEGRATQTALSVLRGGVPPPVEHAHTRVRCVLANNS
jgi:hypothetical protein